MRVRTVLDKSEIPLSYEEFYFVQICCQIQEGNSDDCSGWRKGWSCLAISEIWKLLGAQGVEVEVSGECCQPHTRPPIIQITWRPTSTVWSTWRTASQRGFITGIKMAHFNMTKSLEDYRITLERVTMAIKWTWDQSQRWEGKGSAVSENSLMVADQLWAEVGSMWPWIRILGYSWMDGISW